MLEMSLENRVIRIKQDGLLIKNVYSVEPIKIENGYIHIPITLSIPINEFKMTLDGKDITNKCISNTYISKNSPKIKKRY